MTRDWRTGDPRILVVLLLVFGSGACGKGANHGSDPDILGSAFEKRAVTLCESALARKNALPPFPYPDFNPTRPDLSKLPSIAQSEAMTVKIFQTWFQDMLALGQPPMGQEAWAGVMKALKAHVRIIVEQQAAAARSDGRTFTKDYYEGTKVQDDMERASEAAGVPICATAAGA